LNLILKLVWKDLSLDTKHKISQKNLFVFKKKEKLKIFQEEISNAFLIPSITEISIKVIKNKRE